MLGSAAALALFCLGWAHGAAGAATLRFLYDQTMGPPLVQLSSPETGMEVSGGLFLDLNRAIAKELGLDAVFVAQPRRRLEQVLQRERLPQQEQQAVPSFFVALRH